MTHGETFKQQVYNIVESIPPGRLMAYGQIATVCGRPRCAWEVGQIAHFGPAELPWHRVVNKKGGLAIGWPDGGRDAHKALLEAEGVKTDNFVVDIKTLQWWPNE